MDIYFNSWLTEFSHRDPHTLNTLDLTVHMFALTVGAHWGSVRAGRAVMGCRDLCHPVNRTRFVGKGFAKRLEDFCWLRGGENRLQSDSRRMSLLDKGRRDATKAFCFWKWSRNLLQQSPNRWICFRDCYLLRRLWRSCAGHLHNFATMIKNKRKV